MEQKKAIYTSGPIGTRMLKTVYKNKTAEGEPSAVLKMHSENISLDLIGVNTVLLEKHVSNLAVNTFIDFFDRFSDLAVDIFGDSGFTGSRKFQRSYNDQLRLFDGFIFLLLQSCQSLGWCE